MRMRNGVASAGLLIAVGVAVAIAAGGVIWYRGYVREKEETERIAQERFLAEQAEREKVEREKAEERARKRREEQLAREREQEEREAIRREKERLAREEEAARRLQREKIESARRDYRTAQSSFAKEFRFLRGSDAARLPFGDECGGTYYCAFPTYNDDRLIYRASFTGETSVVEALAMDSLPKAVPVQEFRSLYEQNRVIVSDGENIWLKGVKAPDGYYAVPPRGKDLRLMERQLGSLREVFAPLGVKVPKIACRVTLVSDVGAKLSVIGVYDVDEVIPRSKIRDAASAEMLKKADGALKLALVKKKKYRRTVIKWDGRYVKKDFSGVTYVPRVYEFISTTHHKTENMRTERAFREKWEALTAEAERQEKKAAEFEIKNDIAVAEAQKKFEEKARENASNATSDSAIETMLAKCRLLVECKKTDLKDGKAGSKRPAKKADAAAPEDSPAQSKQPKSYVSADFVSYKCPYLKQCEHCDRLTKKNGLTQSYCEQCYICKEKRHAAAGNKMSGMDSR